MWFVLLSSKENVFWGYLVKSEVILEKDGGLLERITALVRIACGKCFLKNKIHGQVLL